MFLIQPFKTKALGKGNITAKISSGIPNFLGITRFPSFLENANFVITGILHNFCQEPSSTPDNDCDADGCQFYSSKLRKGQGFVGFSNKEQKAHHTCHQHNALQNEAQSSLLFHNSTTLTLCLAICLYTLSKLPFLKIKIWYFHYNIFLAIFQRF